MNHIAIHEREFRGAKFRFYETEHKASLDTFTDEQEVRDAWWHIDPGQFVIDVGACMGSYTLPALALGAHVIAFSPQEPDRTLLVGNVALNTYTEFHLLQGGLHSSKGFILTDGQRMWFSRSSGVGAFEVDSLDRTVPWLTKCDWLKIDVEGFELDVLLGAEETIRRCRPTLLVEYHLFMDPSIELQCRPILKALGYTGTLRRYHAIAHGLYRPEE